MRIDLGSFMFNLNTPSGGTCSWGTALGQNAEYKLDISKHKADFFASMLYKKVDSKEVSCRLGKGGNANDYEFIIASMFDKVYVNNELIEDAKYLLLIVKEFSESHFGRLSLKYNPSAKYKEESINEKCLVKIREHFNLNDDAAWLINNIRFVNQDEIHFDAYFLNDSPLNFSSIDERKEWITSKIQQNDLEKQHNIEKKLTIAFDALKKQTTLWNAYRYIGFKYYNEIDIIGMDKVNYIVGGTTKAPEEIKKGIAIGRLFSSLTDDELISNYSAVKGGFNKIIYGVPGCGKSHYVEHELLKQEGISNDDKHLIRATFFQDYSNTDFIGQILPKLNGDKVEYNFNPGPFTIALEKSLKNPNEKFALVIEEINRGNAASIFGDIFQLLDRDDNGNSKYGIINVNVSDYLQKREIIGYKTIKIPSNLYIFATMNTCDQNVFTLDNAFKRRWDFEIIPNKFTDKHPYKDYFVPGMEKENITWENLVSTINDYIITNSDVFMNEDKQIGIYFIKDKQLVESNVNVDEAKKNQFAYKFFEYLWDDVAKMNHSIIFNNYSSLDNLIDSYKNEGSKVFTKDISKIITQKVEERLKEKNTNESVE